ncbi:molybdopterin molybdotransferase MoeA [Pelagerythrobacter marensis]|uniref:Molybdopterin molybdenumtransferase n=1 Tax=Pelagerythrobacter marensis TaxID=543877 RepID=A0ABZ2D427_9SPHN
MTAAAPTIAAPLAADARPRPGCASPALSFAEARALIDGFGPVAGVERLRPEDAAGRVLAEPVLAMRDTPARDLAAMDGFAIAATVPGGRRIFRIEGRSLPGEPPPPPLTPGGACRVTTGAALPANAARVVIDEQAVRADRGVALTVSPADKPHIRRRASDFAAGDAVLAAGMRLSPMALVTAVASGQREVVVRRRPRVAILATGDELLATGAAHSHPHAIPDSVTPAVVAMLAAAGATVAAIVHLPDARHAIERALAARLGPRGEAEQIDAVVITGGASRGDRDFARQAAAGAGARTVFAGVAMKPGKPVWCARLNERPIVGLPGNPTAALTVARLFLPPLIGRLQGCATAAAGEEWTALPLARAVPANGSREAFLLASLDGGRVDLARRQEASGQRAIARATHLVRRAPGAPQASAGATVETLRI